MMRSGEASGLVRRFFDAYLKQRDLERTLACLTEEIHWVGTGKSELVCGLDEAAEALRIEFTKEPEPCEIVYDKMEEQIRPCRGAKERLHADLLKGDGVNACYAAVLLTASVRSGKAGSESFPLRVTATCVEGRDGICRIAAIHASTPDGGQEEGEFFPSSNLSRFEMEYRLRTKVLDILGRNIPGGMMGGYLEPGYPLYYVNDFMLSYLDFTYNEFVSAIEGLVINCMHPDDRAQVEREVDEAFRLGTTYEIQYRMLKKDGSYIWVNDVGKKGLSEDGREVCISVIRDITEEVETRNRLEEQAECQERLAAQYDRLFQSVLCGIVQYRLDGLQVTFKNANQEAIRIFGYTPEEFWAREDWELSNLIAEEDRERILNGVGKVMAPGGRAAYEYRLLQKDGTPCWIIGSAEMIMDGDGEMVVQSVFMDINERKRVQRRNQRLSEQVEASNEILHLALEHTSSCEFYYYPQAGVCRMPERARSIFNCSSFYENMPESFAREQVEEAGLFSFYEMYERIGRGERTASCEFQGKGKNYWCRQTLSAVRSSEDGKPLLVIGIAEDITRQKEMEEALLAARTRDSLTGLYNKECGVKLIQEYLSHKPEGEHGVLMLLDMDDFKEINRREGNIFADTILQEVADILRAEGGSDSVPIRLGGDEFMLFKKHSNKAEATCVGPAIAAQVKNILGDVKKDFQVSVSIGMCSTEVVEEYNALYRCAESTLKYVKEREKGNAACYLDTSNELGVFLTQLYTKEHPVNKIEQGISRIDDDLVSFALDLLGKSKNLDDAVFLLLSRIGKIYQFDRVSIIEANRAYLTWHFSYQWARSRTDIQLGEEYYVSDEDFRICEAMYDEDGLANRNVREGISRIPSCLHAGIWNYGEYVGSMSFEVYQENYQWTKEQRKLLKELVKVVPSFIMKSRADAVSQAKTDFLSRMSHEIRTPMNAISGMTTIAKSLLDDRDKTRECLEKIEAANGYLLNLINDILDMSRIESGKLELNYDTMDLAQQLNSLESMFRAQATEKGLTLFFENGYRGKRLLRADRLRLNQVLVNVIGNAVKFTEKGSVSVRVEELEEAPRAVLRFSVADTGIGIEPSSLTRIFNAFEQADVRTSACHGGTGLGLSISGRLVQMMGGQLEVHSEVGRGSEFFFTLSFEYAGEEEHAPACREKADSIPDFSGLKILLAEDNELNLEIARTILEMNGFTVTCAVNGQEALERFLNSDPGGFDAVLMDIRMPVMDGLEATRRIRTSGRPDSRTIPVIALTANAFNEDTRKSMESGMNGHLSKPVQVEKMLELLGRCIGRNGQ